MPPENRSSPTFIVSVSNDESKLIVLDELIRAILDCFEETICVLDKAGRLIFMNHSGEKMFALRQSEILGHPVIGKLLFAPELDELELHSGLTSSLSEWLGKASFLDKKGKEIHVFYQLNRISHQDTELLLLRLTPPIDRPSYEEEVLCDSEWNLQAILDTIIDGVIIIDESGAIRLFNPAAEKLFGYQPGEVLGNNVKMLMPSPFRGGHDGYLANYKRTHTPKIIGIGREVQGQRKNGQTFPMYLSVGELHRGKQRLFIGIVHDLTRQKEADSAVLILSKAVEQNPIAIMITNPDGCVTYVNESFTRLTGYNSEDMVGQKPRFPQSGQTPPEKYLRLWRTIREGGIWFGEVQDRKKSGELYWALEAISPIRDETGKIICYLTTQQDITEQKHDKEALRESEERFRYITEMVGEWLWEQDAEGRYTYSSGAVQDILGLSPEEIIGRCYLDFLTAAADRQEWLKTTPPTNQTIAPFCKLINHYRHRDGHDVYTESTGAPLFDAQGRLLKWRGMDLDISARKRFEDALRLRDRAIEDASVGIAIADARQKHYPTIYVNPALCRMTGYTKEELLGQNLRILQGPETDDAAAETIRTALREGISCELTLRNYRKDGTPFWNELLISPVRDPVGEVTHYIGIQNDVTERRRAEEERHEMEIAKHIQLSLLPKKPLNLPTAKLAGICVPAAHVGGDYFDYYYFDDNLETVIADVSGHNVGAALIMTELRSTLKAETRKVGLLQVPQSTAEILRVLNELLYEDLSGAELFITMFYLRYHLKSREIRYANAGHNHVLLLRHEATCCTPLDAEGLILGVKPTVEFEEKSLLLHPKDRLLMYTDGITEAQNSDGEFFGTRRLCSAFSAYRDEEPCVLIEKLLNEVRTFAGKQEPHDDITLLAMEVQ